MSTETSTSTSSKKTKMVTLKSSDNESFELEMAAALQSNTIKNMIEDLDCADEDAAIPLPNVTGATLSKVVEFSNHQAAAGGGGDDSDDKAAVKDLDISTLFDVILAANYLDIKKLLDLTAQAIADRIKNYTPEQVRKEFGIVNDFTAEEEAEVRKENEWAFQ